MDRDQEAFLGLEKRKKIKKNTSTSVGGRILPGSSPPIALWSLGEAARFMLLGKIINPTTHGYNPSRIVTLIIWQHIFLHCS